MKIKKWSEWFTAGKKAAIGVCFLIIAGLFTLFGSREGMIGQLEYLFYVSGLISFVNILFSKLTAQNVHYIGFLLVNGAAVSFVISVSDAAFSGLWESSIASAVIVIILIILWAFHAFMLRRLEVLKRLGMSFFFTLSNIFFMLLAFALVAVLR